MSDDGPLREPNGEIAPMRDAPADDGLALVAREGDFDDRYRIWRGRSGRRYVVTVMPLGEAMRVESAIVLIVAIDARGMRRILWAGESGAPAPGFQVAPDMRIEAHVHLLAVNAEGREEAISDLVDGAQGYSAVLTVSAEASQASVGSVTPIRSNSRTVFTT